MHVTKRHLVITALLASVASVATPAFAQSAPADTQEATPPEQDDVIVTAQKREENIQNVPISIQALGTKKLDQLNVTNFAEYSQLLPSVSFQALGGTPGTNVVYMRGVASGGDGNHSGSLPSVGVYLDEQPVTTIGGNLDVHVYDIARIESLAGPQGTLYGASSEAGTIRIITNKPDTSGFYGRVDGEVNSVNKGGVGGKLEGMINMPFSQDVALRVVGFYEKDAGFIDNVAGCRSFLPATNPLGCTPNNGGISVNNSAFVKKDYNDTELWGGRAALKIDLDDNWTVTPTVIYQDERSHGSYGYDPRVGDLQVQHFYPEYRRDRFIQAALTIEGKLGNWDLTYAGAYLDRKDLQSSDYTDYAEAYDQLYAHYVSSDGSFSCEGIAGCFYFMDSAGHQIDPRQHVIGTDHFKKMSQEFRVSSPQSDRFRVTAGLFYQRQSNDIHQDYQVPGLAPSLSVNGHPGTLWLTQQHRVDKDYAMFGEASFDILPNLTLTGGGRAFIYDNSLIGFFGFGRDPNGPPYNAAASSRTGVAGCFTTTGAQLRDNPGGTLLPAAVDGSPCTNLGIFSNGTVIPKGTQGQGFTHRLNLTWKPVHDVMLYATWSRGFRPGGINRRGTIPPYAADYLTNYEVGFKTTLAGGRLRLNGALYQQEWKKFQFSFLGQNSFTEIHNGPNARIRGAELDANLNLGPLVLTAAGSYTDAKTTQNLCSVDDPTYTCATSSISAPTGTRLPVTPEFKGNATARYTVDWGSAKPYLQAVVAYQSSASSDIRVAEAALLGRLPSFTTANFAAGAEFGNYSVEVFIQNAFDERGQLSRFQECGNCSQRPYIVPIDPRTIGLRLGAKF
jgi:iron complex outermembrane receptor protein